MNRIPITFAQVEQKVRELVAANPDFVYLKRVRTFETHSCVYNQTKNQPACIFGQAFRALGYPIPKDFEGNSIGEVMIDILADGENLSDRDMYWANSLQVKQDNGKQWQVALEAADEKRETYDENRDYESEEDNEVDN